MARDAAIVIFGAFAEFDRDQLVAVVGGAEFQSQVVEQLAFMDSDDDLTPVLLCEDADEARELRDVHLVHCLNGVVEDQTRKERLDSEGEGKKQR